MNVPTKLKRVFVALAILAGGLFLFGCYYYLQLTADIEVALEAPNGLDAKEARRKLNLLETARQNATKGFIRISEIELNSYLNERFRPASDAAVTNTPPTAAGIIRRCRVDLTETNVVLYCWLRKPWLGRTWTLAWQRTAELSHTGGQWDFKLQSMQIGKVNIPQDYWPFVQSELSEVDREFAADLKWFQGLPALELRPYEFSKRTELRIYSYPETNALRRATL